MAINSREARREAERVRAERISDYKARFAMLFHNSVTVDNLADLPKRYLLRTLLRRGGIAYDKKTKLFLPYNGQGVDAYGLPTRYVLVAQNGFILERSADEVVILRANDLEYPIMRYIELQSEHIVDIDMAIDQNLEATKTTLVYEVKDESVMLSVANEAQCRRIGSAVLFRNKNAMQGVESKATNTGATYLVDKLKEAKTQEFNETLASLGIESANVDKRERVQKAEVDKGNTYAKSMIECLVDTFNHDAEVGGLDIRLKINVPNSDEIGGQANDNEPVAV